LLALLELLPKLMQSRSILFFAFSRLLRISVKATSDATAMKRQLARHLITAPAHAPARKPVRPVGAPRHLHAAAHAAEPFKFMLIEKAFLIIRIQELLDESAFALQLK